MAFKPKVVVIGAGLAGLAAAHHLGRHGFQAAVLEAAPRPGGRVAQYAIDNVTLELGCNFFLETYPAVKKLANQLGVPLKRTPRPVHSGIYRGRRFHALRGGQQIPDVLKTARTMFSFQLLSPAGLWRSLQFARLLKRESGFLELDSLAQILKLDTAESAADVLSRFGDEPLDWLYGPGLTGYAFAPLDQIGAACAKAILWHNGLNGSAWPCIPDGGLKTLIEALVTSGGSNIRTSTPVQQITIENATAKGVMTNSGWIAADAVICCTTASIAVKIAANLPAALRGALRRVTYSKCCRVFFGLESNPLPHDWYAVSFPPKSGSWITGLSNAAVLMPETVPKGMTVIDALVIDKASDSLLALSDAEVVKQVLDETARMVPKMPRRLLFAHVHRWPEATGLAPGGSLSELHQMQHQGLSEINGFFVAGDYLGVPCADTAVRSGLEAAAAAIVYLNQQRR